MARRNLFRRLFWYSLALQLLLCLVYGAAAAAAGRGVAAMEEMLLEVYAPAVPIAFLIGFIFGGWNDIGVVLWAFPLIGATFYSLLLATVGGVAAYVIGKARGWTDPGEGGMPESRGG
jgi:hypothetical protein